MMLTDCKNTDPSPKPEMSVAKQSMDDIFHWLVSLTRLCHFTFGRSDTGLNGQIRVRSDAEWTQGR